MNDRERVEILRETLRSLVRISTETPEALSVSVQVAGQIALNITEPTGRATVPAGQVFCDHCGDAVGHAYEHWDDLDGPNVAGWGCHRKVDCPNCGVRVPYGSFHCRGSDELNAFWTCQRR